MDSAGNVDSSNIQAEGNSIAIGGLSVGGNVGGDIRIGHTIGYTSDQVSTLITQISTTFQPKPFDGRSPYKGLDVFEEEDAELFFGREKLVDDLVVRVKESRTVFVTGPSGSGKSSLARAGLIHALKQGAIKEFNSDRWLYATVKPGRDPFEALANAFSRLKSPELGNYFLQNSSKPQVLHQCAESALSERREQRLVLFIDQFEEIFTQLSLERAGTFIELLAHAATVENGRVILLFSMRSDFISNCATYPKLNELLNQQFIQIGAMQPEELVSAMAQPALRVGLRIDPDLIAQVINDMKGEPGALPLMQFTLKDLFDAQQAKDGLIALTLNDYLQHGGIQKSLERHADAAFAKLEIDEQELARSIFSGLIEIGRGTQDTRRTALFDELVPANTKAQDIEVIVQKLADARLIITDEQAGKDTVTISHEKLIDAWPWLKKLVNENRDVIALQNEIASDAKEWEQHKRDSSYLYSGARLATANEQLKSNQLVLSGTAYDFIRTGQARKRRGRTILIGSVALIFILLIAAVLIFANLTREAQNQARIAHAGELSALSLAEREKDFDLALLLGLGGFDTFDNSRTRRTLLSVADSHPGLETFLFGHTDLVCCVAFSPDGKQLASAGLDNSIILWDISDPAAPSQLATLSGHTSYVYSIAFSPDGKQLASGSLGPSIILWDISDPTAPSHLATLSGHSNSVYSVAFSPDGKQLASGSGDTSIILWDISDPTAPSQLATLSGHSNVVRSVAFSPNGQQLASGSEDASIILWDISDPVLPSPLAKFRGHGNSVYSVAFSPDGKQLASGSHDTSIILWDISDPAAPSQLTTLAGHTDDVTSAGDTKYVYSVAFSPDGKQLASGSGDTSIILWDISDPAAPSQLTTLAGHTDDVTSAGDTKYVYSVAFSPDGKQLASGSGDTSIILWDISDPTAPSQLVTLSGHSGGISSVTFDPYGKQLASGSYDTSIILWDVDVQNWIERACQRVGRNFTLLEWELYFPNEEYRKTCEQWPKHSSFYQAVVDEILSADEDPNRLQKAIDRVRSEMQLDTSIQNPTEESVKMIMSQQIATNEFNVELLEVLQQAEDLHINMSGIELNKICWYGSLSGYAVQVLKYCERSVTSDLLNAAIRDSRGLARALTGDYLGAIEDFQFVVDEGPNQGLKKVWIVKRQQWIADLKAGKNPFTPEVLESLK